MSSIRRTSRWFLALLLAAALLASTGCIQSRGTAEPQDQVITVILGPAGVNLNPYTNVLSSRQVGALLFRGMFGLDAEGMPVPDLALEVPTIDNGGMSADGRTITYKLDPDARWADGEPLTASDVVFTWSLLSSGLIADDPRGVDNVVDVVATDEQTVTLTLLEPDSPFAWRFVPYVLPRHLLEDSPDILSDDFWVHPVGSRGWRTSGSIKGTQLDLADVTGERPDLRLVFTETDAAARSVWESQSECVWLSPPVGATGSERFDSVPGARWQAFVMNASAGHPTADLAVRQAFSQVATSTVVAGAPGPYGLPVSDWSLSTADVSAALSRAGWRLTSDGRRFKNGEELVVDVIFNPLSAEEGDRIEYAMQLEVFGGRIEPFPTFDYTSYAGASPLTLGAFDVALVEFPIGTPYGWAWPYESDDVPAEANQMGLNISRVADPELDAAYTTVRSAGTLQQLQEGLASAWARLEALYLVRWDVQLDEQVLYKGVEGVRAHPFEELALREAGEWKVGATGGSE